MTYMRSEKRANHEWRTCLCVLTFLLVLFIVSDASAAPKKKVFPSPEAAVRSLIDAVEKSDTGELVAIFGRSGEKLVYSGDPVMDAEDRASFIKAYREKMRLETVGPGKIILHVGNNDWPMPIPIIKSHGGWLFDTKEGRKEILARRIGRDELGAIQVCLAYVDAQREYALHPQNAGAAEYARQFLADPGKKNGLCWETGADEAAAGPLGPLIAGACPESFRPAERSDLVPYHGYFYRILTAQGTNAPGGAYNYVVNGKMIGGFALVAYPARYRSTGVKTFIVSHDGIVYEKDLGKETKLIAEKMKVFDPDGTWKKVE